jgi:RND superfamily putative drug exporter
VRERRLAGASTQDALVGGIASSAGVVTSAAVIMVAVFSIFATLSFVDVKTLGVGLAFAVLIDATVVRGLLMPAAMVLLGERCWYLPRKLAGLPGALRKGQPAPRAPVREGAPAPHSHRDGAPAPHARVAGALTE